MTAPLPAEEPVFVHMETPLPVEGDRKRWNDTTSRLMKKHAPDRTWDGSAFHAVLILAGLLDEPASAAAGEVRVEWGVRAIGNQRAFQCDDYAEAQQWVRKQRQEPDAPFVEIVHRTVTTSAWQPVTDEQDTP